MADDGDPPPVPDVVREFHDGLADGEVTMEFDATTVAVPSRFDRPAPTAEWRFDGRLTVRVHERGDRD